MTSKIVALVAVILGEMVAGAVVGTIPDPFSSEQIQQLMNRQPVNSTYGQAESWLSLAQKENDSFHFLKGILQLFLLVIAPIATTGVFVWKVLYESILDKKKG